MMATRTGGVWARGMARVRAGGNGRELGRSEGRGGGLVATARPPPAGPTVRLSTPTQPTILQPVPQRRGGRPAAGVRPGAPGAGTRIEGLSMATERKIRVAIVG